MNVIWKPQEKQRIFMSRPEYEVLYGGAAGGGKSDALIVEGLRQVHIPHYKGLILRKTYPQLSELIEKSQNLYPRVVPGCRYNDSKHVWSFPSGAKIVFGSMHHASDKINYQGKAYDFIAFDELTHFTYEEYSYLYSRNRANGPGTRVYIRSTANPGGVGHGWVKKRFIDAAKPLETVVERVTVPDGSGGVRDIERTRCFVPANVFDNKALLANDPNYVANLALLPEAERKALMYGDWESFSGQVFSEWRNNPEGMRTRKWSHVIVPFEVPKDWRIYRGFDFGYAKPFSVGWYAVDYDGRIYRIREYYGCTNTPNEGVKLNPDEIARKIREIENTDINLKGRHIFGICDPSIFDESRGESIAAMMARQGVYFEPGDNTRLAGKMQCHYRLAFDENGIPMFYVFDTCRGFIRTVPNLVYSEKHVEDIDTDSEDHIYDEWRYVCMARPIAARRSADKIGVKVAEDPLDLMKKEQRLDRYGYII